ncbi:MAG: beta-propeller domain-containing protein [Oceanobacter sp.]
MQRTTLTGLLAVGLLAGCGSSSSDNNTPSSLQGDSDLETYLKQGFASSYSNQRNGIDSDMMAGAPEAVADDSAGGAGFSQTNTQESGVDEADLVKQNGSYLFAVKRPSVYWPEVGIADDMAVAATSPVPPKQETQGSIEIYRTETNPVRSSKVGSYAITNSSDIDGLYLVDDQLAVLGQGYISVAKGAPGSGSDISTDALYSSPWYWRDYNVDLQLLDISTPSTPQQDYRLQIEGSLISSRRIDNELYLATRFTPDISVPWGSDTSSTAWSKQLDERPFTDFLPRVWKNGEASGHLFTDGQCHLPDLKQGGYPSIVAVIRINLDNPTDWEARCNSGRIHGVYASSDAFVVTGYPDQQWDATRLDMYDLDSMTLKATGSVPGTLQGSMPSFRISEHNDKLRVITSSDNFSFINDIGMVDGIELNTTTSPSSTWDHRLFVLAPNDSQGFDLVSSLPNDTRPAAIGKPNERIQSVRFRGDRAYVVTFLQTDPLYVLNLSDSSDPYIEGELEIEGFSAYLEPISDNLLLGVGRAANSNGRLRGLKVSLFDTSNPVQPAEITSYELGEHWAYSEVLRNHHAISFLKTDNTLRMAFTWNGYDQNWNWDGNRVHVADIDLADRSIKQSLNAMYEKPTQANRYWYYRGYTRVPLHDDGLHLVNNGVVTSGPLSAFKD